ncbi:MAG: hypothetical protein V4648_06050 [Bacteroidota bacterium]
MKKIIFPLMLVAFLIAFYNQESEKPNVFITVIAVAIFMFGMMKLSANTPSKNQEDDDTTI